MLVLSVAGKHWLGYCELNVKSPTSRNEREKWGSSQKPPLLAKDARNGAPGFRGFFTNGGILGAWGEPYVQMLVP